MLTVSGVADAIHIAVYYVGTILQEHQDRVIDNRQYRPGGGGGQSRDMMGPPPGQPLPPPSDYSRGGQGGYYDRGNYPPPGPPVGGPMPYGGGYAAPPYRDDRRAGGAGGYGAGPSGYSATAPGNQTQHIYIPDELVASVIGKGGQKINEVRQKSGTHIKILELAEMEQQNVQGQPGERLVTITGQPNNIQAAVAMLFARLEEVCFSRASHLNTH